MGERESTVIDRMLAAYSAVAERGRAEHGSVDEEQAMLAAVRELKHASMQSDDLTEEWRSIICGWLNDVLDEPLSPTNPPSE